MYGSTAWYDAGQAHDLSCVEAQIDVRAHAHGYDRVAMHVQVYVCV